MKSFLASRVTASTVFLAVSLSGCAGNKGPTLGLEVVDYATSLAGDQSEMVIELSSTPKFVPQHVGSGDEDFSGNGPDIHAEVRVYVSNGKIWARVFMNARETKSDYTEASGSQDYTIYSGPEEILALSPSQDTYSSYRYRDSNHAKDVFELPESELVREFQFYGDQKGDEAGSATGVLVRFNPARVVVKKGK